MINNEEAFLQQNVERLGHMDLIGGGQVVYQDDHIFVGHMKPPHGTSIINVSDPSNPKIVWQCEPDTEYSHTHKVRVAGDLMITNVEQNQRHFLRKGEKIATARKKLEQKSGTVTDMDIAEEVGVNPEDIPVLEAALARGYNDGGFKVWDISDITSPRELAYVRTHGFGVHRFDMDENFAYISTEMEGYIGNILVTYDLKNPEKPEEVSRWWMPGQHIAGGEQPHWKGYGNRLHHALRVGDEMWAAVWNAGFKVVDVSDITNPRTVAEHNYHPPVKEPTHTVLPFENLIDGRRIAAVVDEEHARVPGPGEPPAHLWLFDVTDFDNIYALSSFHVPEWMSPWSRVEGGRFGAHQFREKLDSNLVYCTWFSGGLRIVDCADPVNPREVGHFIPKPVKGYSSPQSNDVDVDHRGLIYLFDRDCGLDILEFSQP